MRDFKFTPKRFSETQQLIQYIFVFDNNYGAIVNENSSIYNYNEPLFELYVMKKDKVQIDDYQQYAGYKTQQEIIDILTEISEFKKVK